jgi:hypothetical protein
VLAPVGAERMVGFGFKLAWYAVRSDDPAAVMAALGLRDLGLTPWREAVDLAYLTDDRLVVTPPLPGARKASWVLVAGLRLAASAGTAEVVALSVALSTEVQLFVTHRVAELHRWTRAVDGVLVREFGYVGETGVVTHWRGDPDSFELELGLPSALSVGSEGEDGDGLLAESGEQLAERGVAEGGAGDWPDDGDGVGDVGDLGDGGDEVDILLDEDDVMRLAAAWSVDPTSLDGEPSPERPHLAATA